MFLDDDVAPNVDLLMRYGAAICEHPRATGFIGTATLRQVALHIAGISQFWDIARQLPEECELPYVGHHSQLVRASAHHRHWAVPMRVSQNTRGRGH